MHARAVRRSLAGLTLGLAALSGCGGSTNPSGLGNQSVGSIQALITSANMYRPLDSTPSPTGETIYFLGRTDAGASAVLSVGATGGAATVLASGSPLQNPRSLAVSADGASLFIADPESTSGGSGTGRILVLPVGGSNMATLPGSEGTAPRGVTVTAQGQVSVVSFTGTSSGAPAVMQLPGSGAQRPTVVVSGSPLVAPDGVAAASAELLYVSDRGAAEGASVVYKVGPGRATPVMTALKLGTPGGLALTTDGAVLLVSALDAASNTDRVELLNTQNGARGTVTDVVSQNSAGGGVHRALSANVFSWADRTAGGGGQVYRITLR